MSSAPTAPSAPSSTSYGHGLAEKTEILCLSKIDALTPEELAAEAREARSAPPRPRSHADLRRGPARARADPAAPSWVWCRAAEPPPTRRPLPPPSDGPARDQALAARAGWWSRSARRCWSTPSGRRPRGLARRPRPRRRAAAGARPAGGDRHLRCHRPGPRPPRPAAAAPLRLEEKQAAAAIGQILLARAWQESLAPRRPRDRADPDHARGHRGASPLPQRPRHHRRRCSSSASCRWSTRTTPSPPPRSASATMTASPRASPSWPWPRPWSCSPTSTVSTPPTRARTRPPRTCPWSEAITPEIEAMAGGSGSQVGTGGMVSKLIAAADGHILRLCRRPRPRPDPSSRSPPSRPAPAAPCSPPHLPPPRPQGLDRRQPRRDGHAAHRRRRASPP